MRRAVCILAVSLAVLPCSPAPSAQSVPAFGAPELAAAPRIQRVANWLSLVEQHAIGTADAHAVALGEWLRADLLDTALHLRSVLKLVVNPGTSTFVRTIDPKRIPVPIIYSGEELRALRALARQVAAHGDPNHVLKRGALLHTDVALLLPPGPEDVQTRRPRNAPATFLLRDGHHLGFLASNGHLDIARALMNDVTPRPARDAVVRLWYRATIATQQRLEFQDLLHVGQAVQALPDDAEILFLAGCMHEALAAPRVQVPMEAGQRIVGSERAELRLAETLFRQALDVQPTFSEARLRLGRVLGRQGRHTDAIAELRRADQGIDDRLLDYYAALFLGREAEALNRRDEARSAYERAAKLYPTAQSPLLALQRLADRQRGRGAFADLARVLQTADESRRGDPWWVYHFSQSRFADREMMDLFEAFAAQDHR